MHDPSITDSFRRFEEAVRRFDEANAADPNRELVGGQSEAREIVYARRLSEWVSRLAPHASEALRLAARCQHLRRWQIPRHAYPLTKAGYLKWRTDLKRFHAEESARILRLVGYPEEMVERVQRLNLKRDFPGDPECRVLEDALCLVFLQFQLADLAAKTDEGKVIRALRKSWEKMSERGREEALRLVYGPREKQLLDKALGKL